MFESPSAPLQAGPPRTIAPTYPWKTSQTQTISTATSLVPTHSLPSMASPARPRASTTGSVDTRNRQVVHLPEEPITPSEHSVSPLGERPAISQSNSAPTIAPARGPGRSRSRKKNGSGLTRANRACNNCRKRRAKVCMEYLYHLSTVLNVWAVYRDQALRAVCRQTPRVRVQPAVRAPIQLWTYTPGFEPSRAEC